LKPLERGENDTYPLSPLSSTPSSGLPSVSPWDLSWERSFGFPFSPFLFSLGGSLPLRCSLYLPVPLRSLPLRALGSSGCFSPLWFWTFPESSSGVRGVCCREGREVYPCPSSGLPGVLAGGSSPGEGNCPPAASLPQGGGYRNLPRISFLRESWRAKPAGTLSKKENCWVP